MLYDKKTVFLFIWQDSDSDDESCEADLHKRGSEIHSSMVSCPSLSLSLSLFLFIYLSVSLSLSLCVCVC